MALINSRRQRLTLLCALYSAQGVPRGFMTVTLISFLAQEGVSDAVIGGLAATIALPWAGKFVWAPVIDSITYSGFGRRRPWLILAQGMMTVTLLGFMAFYDPTRSIQGIAWVLFAHNWFAALQDVASDALAIDLVPADELGLANGLMMASKAAGTGFGAGVLALVMDAWGFRTAAVVQIVYLSAVMLLPICIREHPLDRRFPWSRRTATSERRLAVVAPFALLRDVARAFSVKSVLGLSLCGCLAAISEWLVEVINKPFYTRHLGWSYVEFSTLTGSFVAVQVAGAAIGAWATVRFGWRRTFIAGLSVWGLVSIAFSAAPDSTNGWAPAVVLVSLPALNSFGSVGFFAVAMRVAWTRSAVTVFTIVMAITSSGHVIGARLIGPLRDGFGMSYQGVYCLAGISMLASLTLLVAVDPAEVDARRIAER